MNAHVSRWLAVIAVVVATRSAYAGSATWNANPVSSDWNTPENWTPATVPNTDADTATFGRSNTTNLTIGKWSNGSDNTLTRVGNVVFSEGASSYTVTVTPVYDVIYPSILTFNGEGIMNNSGVVQNFVAANSGTNKASAAIYFEGSSSAGENVVITNEGGGSPTGDGMYGGFTEIGYQFEDTATAGKATLINNGGTVSGAIGGFTLFSSMSNPESATAINNPGVVSGAGAGSTLIQTVGNIGNSTFIGNPATVTGAEGGWVEIDYGSASGASFIANGATSAVYPLFV